MNKTLVSSALDYLIKDGYSVFPVRPDKRPIGLWEKYQTEFASADMIAEYWRAHPDANIGIATGKLSGIIVVDIDDPKATPVSKFPETYTVRTGNGGYHLYYQHVDGYANSVRKYPAHPGVDIRADGGLVVAPPSVTSYEKDGKRVGGPYTVVNDMPVAPFPVNMFPKETKAPTSLTSKLNAGSGKRNDTIASMIGSLLHNRPKRYWESDVWPGVQTINKTYQPPLPQDELRATFESIAKKERSRQLSLVVSPYQVEGEEVLIPIRKNQSGQVIKDAANVLAVLEHHPLLKGSLKFNKFTLDIEFRGKRIENNDYSKIHIFMQTEGKLSGISKLNVMEAVDYCAHENSYDEAQDWLRALVWDNATRLDSWISQSAGLPNDTYLQGIGSHWLTGLVRRIMEPGCIFDHMLMLVGPQGIGKTSFFRIIGGKWYKSYTGTMDSKDFYLLLRGAMVLDLDEGATMSKTEAIKIKSIITETHDEYRAPYERAVEKHPRRFGFSMSTNDTEPFRDATGNRRYWVVGLEELEEGDKINFKWLQDNRDQLFAEAYHYWKNGIAIPEVPLKETAERQEERLSDDPWADKIVEEVRKDYDYCIGKEDYSTTVRDVFIKAINPDISRLGRYEEMRVGSVFKKSLGLDKKRTMVNGVRSNRWIITKKRLAELQASNDPQSKGDFGDFN